MARTYPALHLQWPTAPDDDQVDRVLAELDAESPTAVEAHADGVRLFFSSAASRDRAAVSVGGLSHPPRCTPVEVSDDDWAERSQTSLAAVTIGRIVVTPPWCANDAGGRFSAASSEGASRGVLIVIQPSMGFGTGHHASTRVCLRLMQKLDLRGRRVIDIGTGSGVLALAAWRLGAAETLAVDSDPDALASASENLRLNNATSAVTLRQLDLTAGAESIGARFDLVLANLTSALLERHTRTLSRLASADGILVVSGFEGPDAAAVAAAFAALKWAPAHRSEDDGWIGLMLRKSRAAL